MTTNRNSSRTLRRWTREEDNRLLRQIKARPQNLSKCFLIVAEEIGRSEKAVAAHWYQHLSKQPDVLAFFTVSQVHLSKNRKNGDGEPVTSSFWQSLIRVLQRFHF